MAIDLLEIGPQIDTIFFLHWHEKTYFFKIVELVSLHPKVESQHDKIQSVQLRKLFLHKMELNICQNSNSRC